ncbi:hypothetical protein B0A49_02837 [Cryomyces minteri]|uniref:J domain-containing protein n=1 Tax=Cryomyces minteri TaxID=331657 RepID=A0A4U0XD45_9PEZI|nr:hypothetical protein B0A49_02837 [Cryomyces minteri]
MPEKRKGSPCLDETDGSTTSKPSKFRFKSKSKRSHGEHSDHSTSAHRRSRRRREYDANDGLGQHHRSHHRSKRRSDQPSVGDDPSQYDDTYLPNSRSSQYLDPQQAFTESLMDALADDEGAAYWEGVYGQPMHIYADTKAGPDGELERMTDEEYTAHVRQRMWEKSREGIEELRRRRLEEEKEVERQRQKDRAKADGRRVLDADSRFHRDIEESLRRSEVRKAAKRWRAAWARYAKDWEGLRGRLAAPEVDVVPAGNSGNREAVGNMIPWPVETGRARDVRTENVEAFLQNAPATGESVTDRAAALKAERVRWHPDKIQQRFGGQNIDAETLKLVTAVFQVVDRMWSEARAKEGG